MTALLILLYVLEINGVVIPLGCYIATWVLVVIRFVCGVLSECFK